jgi:hypothetical protein
VALNYSILIPLDTLHVSYICNNQLPVPGPCKCKYMDYFPISFWDNFARFSMVSLLSLSYFPRLRLFLHPLCIFLILYLLPGAAVHMFTGYLLHLPMSSLWSWTRSSSISYSSSDSVTQKSVCFMVKLK